MKSPSLPEYARSLLPLCAILPFALATPLHAAPHPAFKEHAAVWIEAETAAEAPGLAVDARKGEAASGGLILGVHPDQADGPVAVWSLKPAQALAEPVLAVRHAGTAESRFSVTFDAGPSFELVLPATGGWGARDDEWRWTAIRLPTPLAAMNHGLRIIANSRASANLDCLAVAASGALPVAAAPAPVSAPPAETDVALPPWTAPADVEPVAAFPAVREGRIFLEEYLPAVFTRTLVPCDGDDGGKATAMSWILTGPRSGLTVTIGTGTVELVRRDYDSFGLHPEGTKKFPRFPEARHRLALARFTGALTAVTLTLDHRGSAELMLNGRSVYRGTFAEDLSRHQLRIAATATEPPRWRMLRPRAQAAAVTLAPARTHQTILGFGGIASMPSYRMLGPEGRRRWWELLCENGLTVQREYPAGRTLRPDYSNLGSNDAAIHHYYDDNFPNGETVDFDYLRLHRLLPDSQVWFEYWWQIPEWTRGKPEAYASSIIEYANRLRAASGRGPEIVGVQNEHLDPEWSAQIRALRTQLDDAGFRATRLHMNDHSNLAGGLGWLKQYRADPAAWAALDFTATHQYDFQDVFTDPDRFDGPLREWRTLSEGKRFLSTELCVNNPAWQMRSYRLAFLMAQQYHKTLTLADAVAMCYCWLLLDVEQPTFGWSRSLFTVDRENGFTPAASSHQLRCYAAFSRRIRPGMTRIDAESDTPALLASAYRGDGGRMTTVLLNRGAAPLDVALRGADIRWTTLERVGPNEPNVVVPVANQAAPVRIEPGGMVTLTTVPLLAMPDALRDALAKPKAETTRP